MTRVTILGFGNVGQHLFRAFNKSPEVEVVQVYNRTDVFAQSLSQISSEIFTEFTTSLTRLKDADVYLIAITDDAISLFSEELKLKNQLVVHTSGSVDMELLSNQNRKGVFYALQTFSADTEVDFNEIPICIEAEKTTDVSTLMNLGKCISQKVVEINSDARSKLHLAAVFVNNFVNHLYHISEEIVSSNDLDFELLQPLIRETARKVGYLSPEDAQTGPAKRNDQRTIAKHLEMLSSDQQTLYKILTRSILEKHTKE